MSTVGEVAAYMEKKAPHDSAESWDNVGLLVGGPDAKLTDCVVALDVTPDVVRQAAEKHAQLIVSHHPVIFHPLRTLPPTHPVYRCARDGIAVLSMHTNLDKAAGGVNDVLATRLGLRDVQVTADGFCRYGRLAEPMSAAAFARMVGERLHTSVRLSTDFDGTVEKVGVCSGSGGDLVGGLWDHGVEAVVTGEFGHHDWLDNAGHGLIVEAGHFATEKPVTEALLHELREQFPDVTFYDAVEQAPYKTIG